MNLGYVQTSDKAFLFSIDKYLTELEFDNKVRDKRGYILLNENRPLSLLQYHLFWDNISFLTMLFVNWKQCRNGYG